MQYCYGDYTPLRILDEIEFWKHQEQEHTVVILLLVDNLEENFVNMLKDWGQVLAQTEAVAARYIEAVIRSMGTISPILHQEVNQFAYCTLQQSQSFIAFLNQLASESIAIKNSPPAVTVINHMRRESEYFVGVISVAINVL